MSSGLPEMYLLDVEVKLDKATGELVAFRERSKAEMGAAAAGMESALTGVEAKARTTMTATAAEAQKAGVSFRGLAPTIAATTNALTLLGSQGSPALATITRGVASLASTGFTPLGIAIGLATTALGFFIGRSQDTTRVVAQEQQAIEELVKTYGELVRARSDPAIARSVASRAPAQPTPRAELVAREAELSAMLPQEQADLAAVIGQPGWEVQATRVRALTNAIMELRLEINRLDFAMRPIAAPREALPDFSGVGGPFRRGRTNELADMLVLGMPPSSTAEAIAGATPRTPSTFAADRAAFMDRLQGFYSLEGPPGERPSPFGPFAEHPGFAGGPLTANMVGAYEPSPVAPQIIAMAKAQAEAYARALERDTATMRSFGERGAASITSALNQAVTSGDMDPFFMQLQRGVTDAVVSAFTYAIVQRPLEAMLGNLTQDIGGFLGVGVAGSTSNAYGGGAGAAAGYADELAHLPGASKSARMSPRSVTLLVGDGANVNIAPGKARGGAPSRRAR